MRAGARRWAALLLVAAGATSAQAESLRCNGYSSEVGDSKLAVLQKCGEPLLRDSYCKPVRRTPEVPPVPGTTIVTVLPCEQVDEWLYDRGPGNLNATVRFESGRVTAIEYGRRIEHLAPQR
ncbi:DUF2845 domain-containing protein [Eleftheria terrae]|uniref:DUF2845 domain-containing protein n=1 Tax=Eleftheria terrae TaxID=1597781 RepID=UPI00263A457D|nr:DUF2845 domain-containing protein [Eleftheria terrae]WKB53178.1 DUF2845 domain-containing protein [Eleftheria terrae]